MTQQRSRMYLAGFCIFLVMISLSVISKRALAASAQEIDREVKLALEQLYSHTPAAVKISKVSKGVLVFPDMVKAGLIVGGQYGEGALLVDGKNAGYFNSVAASYGLQAGAQTFGYAMFLMTDNALQYLSKSDGWELGVGPSIVVMDEGMAKSLTTTTGKDDVYAFIFGQKGLMAGIGIQGSKITRIHPNN